MEQGEISRKISSKIISVFLPVLFFLGFSNAFAQTDLAEAAYNQKVRLSFEYGRAWGFDEVNQGLHPAIQEYLKTLNKSALWDFSFHYFGDGENGFGGTYHRLNTLATLSDVTIRVDTSYFYDVELSDEVTIDYYAFSYLRKVISKSGRAKYLLGGSIGVIRYEHQHHSIYHYLEEGVSVGSSLYAGVDYYIARNLDLGLSFNAMFGELGEVQVAGYTYYLSEPISLLRLSLGVGLKLNL